MPGATEPTVSELISQTVAEARQSQSAASDEPTTGGESEAAGRQAAAGPKLPEYLAGTISQEDFDALPEAARATLLKAGKSLHGDYQRKTTDLARQRQDVQQQAEYVKDLATQLQAPKPQTAHQAQSQAARILDTWMAQATDPGQRESLRQLRAAIQEETNVEELKKDVAQLKGALKQFVGQQQSALAQTLGEALAKLPEGFAPLVERYRDAAIKLGQEYPSFTPKKLLQLVSGDEEYEEAVATERAKQVKREVTRAKAAHTAAPAATVSGQAPDANDKIKPKSPWFGERWNTRSLIAKVLPEVRATGLKE